MTQKTAKRDEALWKEFLEEFYEGGKKLVRNTNRDTKDRFPKVEVLTLLRTDPKFRKLVRGQFQRWSAERSRQEPAGRQVEAVSDLVPGQTLEWMENKERVRGVVEKARHNRAILQLESGGKKHMQDWEVEDLQPRIIKEAKLHRFKGRPRWDEFLVEKFGKEGGRTKVRNENPETKDRFPHVEVDTLLRQHKPFRDKLMAEYENWIGKRDSSSRHSYRLSEFVKTDALAGALEQLSGKFPSLKDPAIGELVKHLREDKSPSLKLLYRADVALKEAELGKDKGGQAVEKVRLQLHEPRRQIQHALDPDRRPRKIEADMDALEGLSQVAKHRKSLAEVLEHIKNQDPVEPDLLDQAVEDLGAWGEKANARAKARMVPAALALLNAQAQMYIEADESGMPTRGSGAKRLSDPKQIDKDYEPEYLRLPRKWKPAHEILHYADTHVPVYREKYGDFFDSLDHKFVERAKEYEETVIGRQKDPQLRHFMQRTWEERPKGERELYVGAHEIGEKFYRDVLSMRERSALNKALHAWQQGTDYPEAHALYGLLGSLGVEGGEREGDKAAENGKHRKLGLKNEALKRALAKAMAFSKAYFDHLGLERVTLYRGMRAPEEAQQGDKVQVDGARELAAFSMSPLTAYTFAIGGSRPKRVVKYSVPVERLFLSPLTYPPLGSPPPWAENEFIVAGVEGLKGRVMPNYIDDYDPKIMKVAKETPWSVEIDEDDETAWHHHLDKKRHSHTRKNEAHEFERHREGKTAGLRELALRNAVFRAAVAREMARTGSGKAPAVPR